MKRVILLQVILNGVITDLIERLQTDIPKEKELCHVILTGRHKKAMNILDISMHAKKSTFHYMRMQYAVHLALNG